MAILAFIIVFGILVIVHEFGHFYFAKKAGVLVREFSIGFGPKLFHYHSKETSYTLRLLPLGGYVRLAGAEEEADLQVGMPISLILNDNQQVSLINCSADENLENALPMEVTSFDLSEELYVEGYLAGQDGLTSYPVSSHAQIIESDGTRVQIAPTDRQIQSASVLERMLINFAGPLNNFILAIVVFILLAFVRGGVPLDQAVIGQIIDPSPAASSKLEEGDRVLAVNQQEVESWQDFTQEISQSAGEEVDLLIDRQGSEQVITLTPEVEEIEGSGQTRGKIGVMAPMDASFSAKLSYGFSSTFKTIQAILQSLWLMLSGQFSMDQLGGPVAIFALTGSAVKEGLAALLHFTAYLSINLGIINLLPIPALDGGKILFNIIEGISGKPVNRELEGWITLIAVGFILILMIAVTWNDIQRFFF